MKATIFHNNEHTNIIISEPDITIEKCRKNLKHTYTTIISQYFSSRKNNKVTNRGGLTNQSIGPCPRAQHGKGARLASNKIIKNILVIHSNTCSLTRVTQLHIISLFTVFNPVNKKFSKSRHA